MNEFITQLNDVLWSYVLIVALVGCGIWFTCRTRFVQFRMVGEMLRLLTESAVDTVKGTKHISSFQAALDIIGRSADERILMFLLI